MASTLKSPHPSIRLLLVQFWPPAGFNKLDPVLFSQLVALLRETPINRGELGERGERGDVASFPKVVL